MHRTILIITLMCVQWPLAIAQQQESVIRSFAGRQVRLAIPAGYCLMGRDNPQGRLYYELQEKGNQGINVVAAMFADCKEWKIRQEDPSHRIRRHGSYLFQLIDGKETLAPYSRENFLQEIVTQESKDQGLGLGLGSRAYKEELSLRLNRKLKEADIPTASSVAQINLGLVAIDGYAAFYGFGVTVNYIRESPRINSIVASTIVNGVPVTINLYDDYSSGGMFGRLLNEQKRNAESLVKANPK